MTNRLITSAIERDPIGFKKMFESEMRSRLSEAMVKNKSRANALKVDKSVYVDKDEDTGYWTVFGDNSGFAYGQGQDKKAAETLAKKLSKDFNMKNESESLEESEYKWYSVKGWKDGSRHHDKLDDLVGDNYSHAAIHKSAEHRPDHHIGIPVKNQAAIRYMDKHAKSLNESYVNESSSLKKGYYFWDSADDSIYHEGGHYNTFADIKKVNTRKFYAGSGNVDDSLAIGYFDGKDFWAVDKSGKQKYKLSS
jgi:hypothetical protein